MLNEISDIGMAVSSDHGDSLDVHPTCKQPVGERLARWALNKTYLKDIVPSGPIFRGADVPGERVYVFLIMDKGCEALRESLCRCFEVAEFEGVYYPATAEVVRRTSEGIQ